MTDRSYISIGDVLALLRDEFPDITISKIRFLETRGLLDPERTPSGYRKFYDTDVDRLRWILRQQREHFLPLKVIKGRLEGGSAEDALPVAPSLFDPPAGSAEEGIDDPPPGVSEPALVGAVSAGTSTGAEAGLPYGSTSRSVKSDGAPRASATAGVTGTAGKAAGASPSKRAAAPAGVPGMASTAHSEHELATRGEEESRVAQRPPATGAAQPQSATGSPPPADATRSGASSPSASARTETRGERPFPPPEISFGLPPSMTPASAAERDKAATGARIAAPAHGGSAATTASRVPGGGPKTGLANAATAPGEGRPDGSGAASATTLAAATATGERGQEGSVAPHPPTSSGAAHAGSVAPRAASGTATSGSAASGAGASAGRDSATAAMSSLGSGVSLTVGELAEACGLTEEEIERLEEYGLIEGRPVAGVKCFDEDGLLIARLTAGFAKYGVEPRHLRTYMHAAEREAGLLGQVVMPLLRQRNPLARSRAGDSLAELTELGAGLHAAFLRIALRDLTGG